MKQTTIKDIARRLGINHATVSRAINNDPHISKATKARVLETAAEMHYSPNTAARSLVGAKRTSTIAVVTPAYFSVYSADVMAGIEPEIMKTNYELDYYTTRRFTIFGTAGRDVIVFEKILGERRADALISISGNVVGNPGILERYKKAGIHVIFVEGKGEWGHRVHYDNAQAAVMAVNHLVERGRKRIGMLIGNTGNVESYRERLEGFKKAMHTHGLKADGSNVFSYLELGPGLHKSALNFFLEKKIDAVYVGAGEFNALRLYEEAGKMGIKFPDDIALVSQDDMRISSAAGFTSVRQPVIEMGMKAVEIAVRAIETKDMKTMYDETFYPELIVRRST
jgi:LacI family transcriptional regulator